MKTTVKKRTVATFRGEKIAEVKLEAESYAAAISTVKTLLGNLRTMEKLDKNPTFETFSGEA